MATIVHFDISAADLERAKRFYESLFGWKITGVNGFEGYYEIETTDLNGLKSIGGGLTKRDNLQQPGITNFIGVLSIDEAIAKLTALGGMIIQPKQAIPGYGFVSVCADTESNRFGLFQDDKQAI